MADPIHIPVLVDEVLTYLAPRPNGRYVDATVGGGGHTRAILDASAPDGQVLGLDRDPDMIRALEVEAAQAIARGRLRLAHASFAGLADVLSAEHSDSVDGVLFDLGVNSYHFDVSTRGFTFARDEPLDMRFDPSDDTAETAAEILASRSADELTELLRTYGEERFASRIARTLVARRRTAPVRSSRELFAAIEQSLPAGVRWRAGRDAARVFQALRIAANDELGAVGTALPQALDALRPGGRLVVIAFHSLEDRLVKNFLRDAQRAGHVRILTKKPIQPSAGEIAANPRAASAKLRAAEKV